MTPPRVKKERRRQKCQCGCGQEDYSSKFVRVTIDQATDVTRRRTEVVRAFDVLKTCEEPFKEELGLMVLLDQLLRAWVRQPSTVGQKMNPFRGAWKWLRRIFAAHRILRMQHAIYVRNKGFEWARRHAIQSAILFGCPRWMQGFLSRRFLIRAKRREFKENAARQDAIAEACT